MKISREDVLKVAALANLELSDAEVDNFRGQLDDILTYIDKLNEVDTSGVEPLTQVVAASADDSALREDVIVRADVITEVLQGAPDPEAPYFRVPRVPRGPRCPQNLGARTRRGVLFAHQAAQRRTQHFSGPLARARLRPGGPD